MLSRFAGLCLALGLLTSPACKRKAAETVESRYWLAGEVLRLDPQNQVAAIKHGPIANDSGKVWMEAMTMEFPVRDAGEFARLREGQKVRATVHQIDATFEYWIDEIKIEADQGGTKK